MPQLAPVVLKDSLNVDHTFNPRGIVGGVATLAESSGVPIGNQQLTVSHTVTAAGRHKAVLKASFPVVQNVEVSGVTRPTVVRTAYLEVSLNVDAGSSTQERADALALVRNALGASLFVSVFRDLEDVY